MKPNEVRKLRRALGLTQEQLADAVEVHPRTINRWENGHTEIPKWRAEAMRRLREAVSA